MAPSSRRKGKHGQREIVSLAHKHGLEAQRTWQSAQSPDAVQRRCDVLNTGRPAPVKVAAEMVSKALYDALEGVEMAFREQTAGPC